MKVPHIIGADLSKKTIDFASPAFQTHIQVSNSIKGFQELITWMAKQKLNTSEVVIVMEHTGLYSWKFEDFLHRSNIAFAKVSGLAIKRSMGLVRGKNDKIDAQRIAQYGSEKQKSLRIEEAPNEKLKELKLLYSTRAKLVNQRAGLITTVQEYQKVLQLKKSDLALCSQLRIIKTLDLEIKNLDAAIKAIIETDEKISNNYCLQQSITGVGKVVALAMIIKTGNFTRFPNSRKFATFCGTAPFAYRSGTSIRGKTKVSHLADKSMKTLLDLSAKSAIQHDKELREYYLRRIAAGKSKMSTINIVRNKILHRIFAVINRQTPYQPIFNPTL
jgi:transposase